MAREYSFYLRVAHASTMVCPVEHYSESETMWVLPEPGTPFNVEQIRATLVEDVPAPPEAGSKPKPSSADVRVEMPIPFNEQQELSMFQSNLRRDSAHQQAAEEGVARVRRLALRTVRAPAHRARLLD